ncbi:hypothetical protein PENTCL1PPCAC_25912, partial [Pristionchus entomophagus]
EGKEKEKEKQGKKRIGQVSSPEKKKQKPEDKFPFGKAAALGHSDNFNKEGAPDWAAKEGRGFVGVFAPHHSIFDGSEPLPCIRQRKTIHDNLKF